MALFSNIYRFAYRHDSKDDNRFICNLLYKEYLAHKMASTYINRVEGGLSLPSSCEGGVTAPLAPLVLHHWPCPILQEQIPPCLIVGILLLIKCANSMRYWRKLAARFEKQMYVAM